MVVSELNDKHLINFSSDGNSEYWQQWYYQISNLSAQQLIRTLNDLLAEENTTLSSTKNTRQSVEEGESPD